MSSLQSFFSDDDDSGGGGGGWMYMYPAGDRQNYGKTQHFYDKIQSTPNFPDYDDSGGSTCIR